MALVNLRCSETMVYSFRKDSNVCRRIMDRTEHGIHKGTEVNVRGRCYNIFEDFGDEKSWVSSGKLQFKVPNVQQVSGVLTNGKNFNKKDALKHTARISRKPIFNHANYILAEADCIAGKTWFASPHLANFTWCKRKISEWVCIFLDF